MKKEAKDKGSTGPYFVVYICYIMTIFLSVQAIYSRRIMSSLYELGYEHTGEMRFRDELTYIDYCDAYGNTVVVVKPTGY